jgi:hypothetical protein
MTQKSFFLLILALAIVGAGCKSKQTNTNTSPVTNSAGIEENQNTSDTNTSVTTDVHWDNTENGWMAFGTPPACPDPFVMQSPINLSEATSVLYPGQSRPDYKPHGGFRFDRAVNNAVSYKSPIDGEIIRGARYFTDGQVQYTFDIVHPCGMMARIGHLLTLTPKFQAIAEQFPPATVGDSRTTRVQPQVKVTVGEEIATHLGVKDNAFADLGLFDLRQKNEASKDPAYAAAHGPELEQHAVCWFDNLPAADEATVRALPAGDPKAGKSSDYCK